MPLPYPIIEARFQMLDASIAKAASASAKHIRLNASDALRETVRQTRKPTRRTPAVADAIPRPAPTAIKTSSNDRRRTNQYEASHRRLSMAASHAHHSLLPSAPQPAFHTWGESTTSVDPKEARLHAVAQETWAAIEQGLQSTRPCTANAAATPTRPVSRGTKAKSAGATRGSLASSASRHQLQQAQSTACASPHAAAWESDSEASDDEEEPEIDDPEAESLRIPAMPVRRPPPTIRKPSSKQLLRSGSAGSSSSKLPRNWLQKAGTCNVLSPQPPSKQGQLAVQCTTSALAATTAPPDVESVDSTANIHDASFYFLEIRLEHSSSLAGWTFRVLVTDITATDRPQILISNMTCNDAHCILFLDPITKAFSTLFNPLLYFDHVTSPIELYDHSLHIQVISETPIQKPIVDTYVHYTVGPDDNTPLPDLEPLQLQLEPDATTPAPPCSTLDNSAYIYANHFEARTASSPTKPMAPLIQSAPQTPLEARKNELQRMRQSMRNELLLEQQRLSLSLR